MDLLWPGSILRNSRSETIESNLQGRIDRPVTLSCYDEPRPWVRGDGTMFMIFPVYRHALPGRQDAGKPPYLLNLIRKCWYEVRWLQECSRNEEVQLNAPADGSISLTSKGSGIEQQRLNCIYKLNMILQSAPLEDWELIRTEVPSILLLREEVATLAGQTDDTTCSDNSRRRTQIENLFRHCADEILKFERIVMPTSRSLSQNGTT